MNNLTETSELKQKLLTCQKPENNQNKLTFKINNTLRQFYVLFKSIFLYLNKQCNWPVSKN